MYMRQRMYVCIHIYVCKSKSSNKKLLLASFGENRCVSKQKRGVSKQNRGVSKQNLFCHELLHRERSITRNFVMVKKSIAGQNFRHFVRRAKCTAALRGHFEGDPSH